VAAVRVAVRRSLVDLPDGALVLVACSGGADSLALAAAVAFEAPRAGLRAGAVVVDHGLQVGSDVVAARAGAQCRALGLAPVEVARVHVGRVGGPEAAARTARHAAFEGAATRLGAVAVLLAHTRDDQAEQVLLGLARGSGARSLSGMPPTRRALMRPLLQVDRHTTVEACMAQGLEAWDDPQNADTAYLRVRARALLPILEQQLGPGVVAGLARSAERLRDDADLLDRLAREARSALGEGPWEVSALQALPDAIRTRVWRLVATGAGSPPGSLFAVHVAALDALVTDWHGQGPVDLPGHIQATRAGGRVTLGGRRPLQ